VRACTGIKPRRVSRPAPRDRAARLAAFWELLEWWTVLATAPEVGQAFLGMQGDVWDAQWDMLLALVAALIVLPVFGRWQDASMAKVPVPRRSLA
jgi:putative membrane protein